MWAMQIILSLLWICMAFSYSPTKNYLSTFYSTSKESIIDGRYKVMTIEPASLDKNLKRVFNLQEERENIKIKELIYIPSLLHKHSADEVSCILDDEHFISLLAEQGGYMTHILTDTHSNIDQVKALDSIVSWRCSEGKLSARQIALMASELACPRLLTYLSDIALPFKAASPVPVPVPSGSSNKYGGSNGKQRYDIGACVLIQPPPILALRTDYGRDAILKRYTPIIHSQHSQDMLSQVNGNVLPILQNIAANRPGDRDNNVLNEEYILQQQQTLQSQELKLQRELEIMERESDPSYKRKKDERAKSAKRRGRKKKLNHIPVTRTGDVITNKVLQQQRPCSVQDLVGYPVSTMKALDVGNIMKDRILLICTDDDNDDNDNGGDGDDDDGDSDDGIDGGNNDYFFAFPEEDLWAWGRECTWDTARLYSNEPVVCLQDVSMEDCYETDSDIEEGKLEVKDEVSGEVWTRAMAEKHVKLYSVIYQWLSLLRV